MSGEHAAWQLFERDPAGYEDWYGTARGRRADLAERALLEHLLAPFPSACSALEVGCGTGHFTSWLARRLPRVAGLDRAPAMLAEARRRHPGLSLIHSDAHDLPIRARAIDLSILITTLEFLKRPELALAEAVRVANQGVLLVALNRWSPGGFSRRWGADARRTRLGRARDFSLAQLRALAATAAGPRLREIRWACTLFPGCPVRAVRRIPFGDVIGIAVHLAPR